MGNCCKWYRTHQQQPGHLPCHQANERGRQARERAQRLRITKAQRALEERRQRAGVPLTPEEAVMKIQSCMRGHLWRRSVRHESEHELAFINMKPKVGWCRGW
jgi:hypothetical protein